MKTMLEQQLEAQLQAHKDELDRLIFENAKLRDPEPMIRACVPGGSICDPQQVADAIRDYFKKH